MIALFAALAFLSPDRAFDRDGVFKLAEPAGALATAVQPGGATLHLTTGGMLRLDAAGRRRSLTPLNPAGAGAAMLGHMVVGTVYDSPALHVWLLDRDGTTVRHSATALPGARTVWPAEIVRRGSGYAVRYSYLGPGRYRVRQAIVALQPDGEIDNLWGEEGFLRIADRETMIGDAGNGRLVLSRVVRRCSRTRAPLVGVQRIGRTGRVEISRRLRLGRAGRCRASQPGEILRDGRRLLLSGAFGDGLVLAQLDHRLRLIRRRHLDADGAWGIPMQLARTRRGYAFAFTEGDELAPYANAGTVDRGLRRPRFRRLRRLRDHPTSEVSDLAVDRRGRLVAAGALRDTDVFIREDYGQPHLAVWRLVP